MKRFVFSGRAVLRRRGGFTHVCFLTDTKTGISQEGRACWCNRTWEPYPFYCAERDAIKKMTVKVSGDREALDELAKM